MVVYTCSLDARTGRLPRGQQPDFIYRIKCGDSIQFQLDSASDLNSASTMLLIDLAKYEGDPEFVEFHGQRTKLKHWLAEVNFPRAGTYTIQLQYKDRETETIKKANADYLVVEADVTVGGETMPMDALVIQTVLSRSLGPYTRWSELLLRQKELGYNMIHFTPLQELGASQSLYSLADQLKLNDTLFPGLLSDRDQLSALSSVIASLDYQGVSSCIDIVLNHMAVNSEFLEVCPSAAYTLDNSPYLRAAYELDRAIQQLSRDLVNGKVSNYKHGNIVDCDKDLANVMQIIKLEIIPRLKLQEFFSMDQTRVMREVQESEEKKTGVIEEKVVEFLRNKGLEDFIKQYALLGEGEGRNAVRVDCGKLWAAWRATGVPASALHRDLPAVLKSLNAWLLSRFERHLADIIKNIEGDIRYFKLEKRETVLSAKNSLIRSYFHELQNGSVILCNGFIFDNKDVTKDIAGKGQWNYLRRKVVIWDDSAKLRYGEKPEDCPELWERMKEYVVSMARIFKGFRLDNAHGTPLEVSEYMLMEARKINPNLIIIAELFTGNSELDAMFVSRLGINMLIREAMNAHSPRDMSSLVYRYGNGETKSVGSIEPCAEHADSLLLLPYEAPAAVLVPTITPALFYDCTHDNETPAQKRTPMDALPNAAIVCFTNTAVASTRGYDELVPNTLSITDEMRLYRINIEQPEQKDCVTMGAGTYALGLRQVLEFTADSKTAKVEIKGSWDNWQNAIELQ